MGKMYTIIISIIPVFPMLTQFMTGGYTPFCHNKESLTPNNNLSHHKFISPNENGLRFSSNLSLAAATTKQ